MRTYLKSILSVDVETTGLDPGDAEIIELGVVAPEPEGWFTVYDAFYKPVRPIPPASSAVHGITESMVADRPVLTGATAPMVLTDHPGYFTAHNAGFDRILLDQTLGDRIPDGVSDPDRWICTYRLARHLLPGLPSYSLQYLRYYLSLPLGREVVPHQAGPDALIGGYLLEALAGIAVDYGLVPAADGMDDRLARLARIPIHIETWPLGQKYKGVALTDLPDDYLEWAVVTLDSLNEKSGSYDPDLAEAVASLMISRGYQGAGTQ